MKPLFCCLLLLASVCVLGQGSTIPEFGHFTEEEKKMTECPFDKEADAIVLIDQASSDHDDEYRLITNRRIRIKVLKEKGIAYGDVMISYYHGDDFEFISGVEAVVCNVDASGIPSVQKVANAQIFRQKINEYYSAVKFAMPGVKVGSIIEYRYVSNKKSYSGLEDWFFQRDIPTRHSSFSLVILPNYEFAYSVHKSEDLPIDIKSEKGSGKIIFEMNNVAGLRDEPFMDSERDYIQRVEFQMAGYRGRFGDKSKHMTTWAEAVKELLGDQYFGRQLVKNLAGSAAFMTAVKAMSDPYKKMEAVYNYVQKNLNWNGFTARKSESVKNAWEKQKGNYADINLILVNLLQEAGLEAYPMLVSTRGNGKVDVNYPFIEQFNVPMAYVIIGDNKYVLDGVSYGTPAFTIPFSVVNTTAFVVDRKKGGLVTLTENKRMNRNYINVTGSIDKDGVLSGRGLILSYDYARINRLKSYHRDKAKFPEEYLIRGVPGLALDSLQTKNIDNDSLPFEQNFLFKMPSTDAGEYRLLQLNLFSGFEKNPFIANNRFTNIDYGCLQNVVLTHMITVPDEWQPETLPRDVKLIMPDTSVSILRMVVFNKEQKTLMARYTIQTNRSVFTANEYAYLKEFYKKMTDILNEQVVLRKKTTP
jgi:hypothetical protein